MKISTFIFRRQKEIFSENKDPILRVWDAFCPPKIFPLVSHQLHKTIEPHKCAPPPLGLSSQDHTHIQSYFIRMCAMPPLTNVTPWVGGGGSVRNRWFASDCGCGGGSGGLGRPPVRHFPFLNPSRACRAGPVAPGLEPSTPATLSQLTAILTRGPEDSRKSKLLR